MTCAGSSSNPSRAACARCASLLKTRLCFRQVHSPAVASASIGSHIQAYGSEAEQSARFSCPACDEHWSEAERVTANHAGRLVRDGQAISLAGVVAGHPPATDTLGFRWSAVNNLFATTGEIAAEEWQASRAADEDNADRERRQFVWCLPVVPTKWTDAEIETHELASQQLLC